MTGKEIGALRRQGKTVTEQVDVHLFAFLGDTTSVVLERHPALLKYPLLFIECSFIRASDDEQAEARKHVCWTSLKPFVVENPNTTFVLVNRFCFFFLKKN